MNTRKVTIRLPEDQYQTISRLCDAMHVSLNQYALQSMALMAGHLMDFRPPEDYYRKIGTQMPSYIGQSGSTSDSDLRNLFILKATKPGDTEAAKAVIEELADLVGKTTGHSDGDLVIAQKRIELQRELVRIRAQVAENTGIIRE